MSRKYLIVQIMLHIYLSKLKYLLKTRMQSNSKHQISSIAVIDICNYGITLLVTLLTVLLIVSFLQIVTDHLKFCTEDLLNGLTNIK